MSQVTSDKILQLRELLTQRFGQNSEVNGAAYFVGLAVLDEIGIPCGKLTEIVPASVTGLCGSLLFYSLLHAVLKRGEPLILIDGKNSFAPKGLRQIELNRLLWVRCHQAWEAIKAADLVMRDGNIPLVVLLLTLNAPGEMRRIPATAWHRLQMLAEKSAVTLVVFTPQAQIGCAQLRLLADGAFPLEKLHDHRDELIGDFKIQVARRRMSTERNEDEELHRAACA